MSKFSFLNSVHPAYKEMENEWKTNQRRMLGGPAILEELSPFDWEITSQLFASAGRDIKPQDINMSMVRGSLHYNMRQQNAVYLNFPDRFASIMSGHLMRNSPMAGNGLSFGTLGDVRRKQDVDVPTPAELLYYNADGVGVDGSQWNTYWMQALKGAISDGVRWILCEGPSEKPLNQQDWIRGLRPYLTDYSPLSVKNWLYERGELKMAIIHRKIRKLRLRDDALEGNDGDMEILLLTADGFEGFGQQFRNGGWYKFNTDLKMTGFGFFENTDGKIPLVPMYYERMKPGIDSNRFCRSGVYEMGNAAVAYMNLSSAADFDAQDSASSVVALRGVDPEGFNLFVAKVQEGNRYSPIPPHKDMPTVIPELSDASTGATVADVFNLGLKRKREEAEELMLNELQAAPYASGRSKQVSFADAKEPRLAVLAAELATAQNAVIHFMEQMWGKGLPRPSGAVEWPETFALERPLSEIREFFQTVKESGMRSPTAEKKAMIMLTRKLGITGDDESRQAVERELDRSAALVMKQLEKEAEPEPLRDNATVV